MKAFSLNVEAPINGIYLSSGTIDLLSIIQCKDRQALQEFARNCSQLNLSEQDMFEWTEESLEELKRKLVEQYKGTFVPRKQGIQNRNSVLQATLEHCGIPTEEIMEYMTAFQNDSYEGMKQKLQTEHPKEYVLFAQKVHRFVAMESDQITSVTYEELEAINRNLPNHNTILIGVGRYYNVTQKLYNEHIPDMPKYDFYYAQRGLDFCCQNGMHARYHTLLDKQTMEEQFAGKPKEEVIRELEAYVKQSIDFISQYNAEHQIDGRGVISSIDLFNEIISFDPPYRNMWQELYGISTEELTGIYQYAQENKPEGVTYVYNEPFLENPERRQAVIAQLRQIMESAPGLIDTIGTQMHIEMTQDIEGIRQCFLDLKQLEDIGIGTQITEFDMCLPERHMFDEQGNLSQAYTPEFIYNYKTQRMAEVSDAIAETGIELEGITYWSVSDTLDHNLERTNQKTYQKGLARETAHTRYAGLYADFERRKTVSIQRLGKETLEEQKDTTLLDEIEQAQVGQERERQTKGKNR